MQEETNNYTVYMHTNKINNKKYVGITKRPVQVRWGYEGKGYRDNQPCFQSAIQKYGWDNFEHEILFENLTLNEANQKEKELIKLYNTKSPNGYNLTDGGDGGCGCIPGPETRRKMSEARRGEKNPFYGKHHSEELRIMMSESRKGTGTKEDNPFYGKKHTEETRKILSEHAKKRTGEKNPNYGNHKLAGENHPFYGKHLPEKTRQKISESRKEKYSGINSYCNKKIYCFENDQEYYSMTQASNEFSIPLSTLTCACKNKSLTAKKYHFQYSEDITKAIENQEVTAPTWNMLFLSSNVKGISYYPDLVKGVTYCSELIKGVTYDTRN